MELFCILFERCLFNFTETSTKKHSASDIVIRVRVFRSKKGSPYTENPGNIDIPLTVTLFGRRNTVTESGETCTSISRVKSCLLTQYIFLSTQGCRCQAVRHAVAGRVRGSGHEPLQEQVAVVLAEHEVHRPLRPHHEAGPRSLLAGEGSKSYSIYVYSLNLDGRFLKMFSVVFPFLAWAACHLQYWPNGLWNIHRNTQPNLFHNLPPHTVCTMQYRFRVLRN